MKYPPITFLTLYHERCIKIPEASAFKSHALVAYKINRTSNCFSVLHRDRCFTAFYLHTSQANPSQKLCQQGNTAHQHPPLRSSALPRGKLSSGDLWALGGGRQTP